MLSLLASRLGPSGRRLTALVVLTGVATMAVHSPRGAGQMTVASDSPFIVKPYLQLGDLPRLSPSEPVRVLWQAANDTDAKWTVDVRQRNTEPWRSAIVTGGRLVGTSDAPYRLFNVRADEARARQRLRVSRLEERRGRLCGGGQDACVGASALPLRGHR